MKMMMPLVCEIFIAILTFWMPSEAATGVDSSEEMISLGPGLPRISRAMADQMLDEVARCTNPENNLYLVAGEWLLFLMSEEPPSGAEIDVRLSLKSPEPNRLTGTLDLGDGRVETVNLLQLSPEKPNVLLNIFDNDGSPGSPQDEDNPKIIPVLLIADEPNKWVTFWQGGNGTPGSSDWAVYVRPDVTDLTESEIERATRGLSCLNLAGDNAEE